MKIWLLSDIHLDHAAWSPPTVPDADVAVIAGDVKQGAISAMEWIRYDLGFTGPVVYVLGNHEFYGSSLERECALARDYAAVSGIHLLDDGEVVIDGVRFVGSTLWSDFDVFARGDQRTREEHMAVAQAWINDFKLISERDFSFERFTPRIARAQHQASRAYLDGALAVSHAGPTVVVSHHAPSPHSIAADYKDSRLTPAFVSNLELLIQRHQPAAWLHGHVHDSFDYRVGGTRVVCNPRGYGDENRRRFDPALVVEV